MMKRTFLPFCVLLLTLLSACAPSPVQSSSDPQQPPAGTSSNTPDSALNSSETLAPAPRLTQEDMDQAIQQVIENYSATALSVAVVERGEVTQCSAWGWAVPTAGHTVISVCASSALPWSWPADNCWMTISRPSFLTPWISTPPSMPPV